MPIFSSADFSDHEQVIFAHDKKAGLKAIVAIHSSVRGPAIGGTRMWPYASEEDALHDVLRLSKGMSYKTAIAGLPYGGGKAVIIGDSKSQKTEALLHAYGRFLESLGGRFITAEDVGTTVGDMDVLRTETAFARGQSDGTGNPSPATAYGVYCGIKAAVKHKMGCDTLKDLKIGVQGLGNVGFRLCRYLHQEGATLIVSDINHISVNRAVSEFRATPVEPDDIFDQDMDVFSPCALGSIINDETISRLRARIVAGSANNQLALDRHGLMLWERGILYAPDYVINGGGVIDVASEGPGYSVERVLERVATIGSTLDTIFSRAARESLPPNVIADKIAESRLSAKSTANGLAA